jgi:hypothetical protein
MRRTDGYSDSVLRGVIILIWEGRVSDSVKHSLIWASVAIVMTISIPWVVSTYYVSVVKAAIDAGLEQKTLPGAVGVYWVRVEK